MKKCKANLVAKNHCYGGTGAMLIVLWYYVFFTTRVLASDELCFTVIGDMGGLPQPPYHTASQVKVAKLLAKVTASLKCSFVMGLGDNFYFNGVKNVNDPRFQSTFERTYADKSLAIPWYMIAGNHDHASNITAQIAYSRFSKRWNYPDYFYSKEFDIPGSRKTLQLLMIDTTMLCNYNKRSGSPPPEVQLRWIENKLRKSKADYLLVGGHHPIYSGGSHGNTLCLHEKLKPLLEEHKVTAYFSGHDHNMQHIKEPESPVHYFISGSGNFVDGRMPNKQKLPRHSLKRHFSRNGFLVVCINKRKMKVRAFHHLSKKSLWFTESPLRPRRINRIPEIKKQCYLI